MLRKAFSGIKAFHGVCYIKIYRGSIKMIKEYVTVNDGSKRESKLDFYEAVTSMINGRNYLAGIGFKSVAGGLQGFHANSKIVLSDGSEVLPIHVIRSDSIDEILKKVIEKKGDYIRPEFGYVYSRESLLITTMQRDEFIANFKVADVTNKRKPFILKPFFYNPSQYSSDCNLVLSKSIIDDQDVTEFYRIQEGLEEALHQEGIHYENLIYQTNVSKEKKKPDVKVQPVQTDFINPWIEIPEFGDNK